MMIELSAKGDLRPRIVGGKAHYLGQLLGMGIRVPRSLVLPVGCTVPASPEVAEWLNLTIGKGDEWNLAIRSSSAHEDRENASKAGHFLSVLGAFTIEAVGRAIEDVRRSGPEMAVLIQPLIGAQISGVAFSCDPLSYTRSAVTVVWTKGRADGLVSGIESGNEIRSGADGSISAGSWPMTHKLFDELLDTVRKVENELGCPVDVEWVIDSDDRLWLVQARPVVLPQTRRVVLDSQSSFSLLPALVQQHHKVRLRRAAANLGVKMAPAIAESRSIREVESAMPPLTFPEAAGVSVVLLHPERIDDQVVRDFAAVRGTDVEFFSRGCLRYAIRRYPGANSVEVAVDEVLEAGLAKSWTATVIAQAVWGAYATGIARKFGSNYVIDIALGHFVPKGVVPTTTAVLSESHQILSITRREQTTAYHFVDGHVLTETPPLQALVLSDELLGRIVATLEPLFDAYVGAALEFGVLGEGSDSQVYLIDLAEGDSEQVILDTSMISSGVLSPGTCRGRVKVVTVTAIGELDRHLHDRMRVETGTDDSIIVVANRASVELLPLVGVPGVVGFIFETGSIMSHLAVVLRENGVPAITIDDRTVWESLLDCAALEVDASNPLLSATERVTVVMSH